MVSRSSEGIQSTLETLESPDYRHLEALESPDYRHLETLETSPDYRRRVFQYQML